jgi:hypothetical protein
MPSAEVRILLQGYTNMHSASDLASRVAILPGGRLLITRSESALGEPALCAAVERARAWRQSMWAALVDLGRASISGEVEGNRAGEWAGGKKLAAVLAATMSNLDGFITHKQPLPEPLATSAEIQDRQSTFLACIFRASTPEQARRAHSHVRRVIHAKHPASHEIMAWRCMVLKEGRTGLRGDDDFKIEEGCEDDGEQRAGGHILKVMRSEAIMDAVVIVSRW